MTCSRRTLLKGLGVAAMLGAIGCQTGTNLSTAKTATCTTGTGICLDLSDAANAELATVGGAMLVDSSRDTIVVIRISATEVIALSAVCTHAGCLVDYDASAKDLTCPCHGSVFAQSGSVKQGPARSPLATYQTTLAGTLLTIAA